MSEERERQFEKWYENKCFPSRKVAAREAYLQGRAEGREEAETAVQSDFGRIDPVGAIRALKKE